MDRERRGSFISQIGNLAKQMLPVLDNLDRALDSIKDVPEKKRNELKQFFDGITLVNHQINEVFSDMGVQPIVAVGETFDPNFHEAVATDEESDLPPNTISAEMLRGFRIGNLVIRHSMVRVTPTPAPAKKSDQKEAKNEPEISDTTATNTEPTDLAIEEPPSDFDQA
jgi:molecular chaperone GrpE